MRSEIVNYNFETYHRHMNDPLRQAFIGHRLRVGDIAPDFTMSQLGGTSIQLSTLTMSGNVALVFGCWSAPPLLEQLRALDELHDQLEGKAQIIFIYTREIHPNQSLLPEIPSIPPHRSFEEKSAVAAQFRDRYSLRLPIAVDDLEGSVHLAYGTLPCFQVVIDRNGIIMHIAEWTSIMQLAGVLTNLQLRDRLAESGNPRMSYSETMWCVGDLKQQ